MAVDFSIDATKYTGSKVNWVVFDEAADINERLFRDQWLSNLVTEKNRAQTAMWNVPAISFSADSTASATGAAPVPNASHLSHMQEVNKLIVGMLDKVSHIIAQRDARIDALAQRIVDLEMKLEVMEAIKNNPNFGTF